MKKLKQYQDVIAGVIFLVVSVLYYSGSFFETSALMQAKYGPEFMPRVYAVLMAVLSAALIITGLRKARSYEEEEDNPPATVDKRSLLAVAASLLLIAVYIFLIETIGFLIASALYLLCQSAILAKERKWIRLVVFAAVGAVLIYLLFSKAIGLVLPKGIFGF